mgnify:CR=1 FL=1
MNGGGWSPDKKRLFMSSYATDGGAVKFWSADAGRWQFIVERASGQFDFARRASAARRISDKRTASARSADLPRLL